MNCYRVYSLARSTAHRTVRHVSAAWIVSIVCVGVPLATLPLVPWDAIPATTQAQARDGHGHGDDYDHPHSVPCPGALVVVPGMAAIIIFSKRKISVDR